MNWPQKTHKLKTGQKIGEWTLIQKIPYIKSESSNKRLKWRVQCSCGQRETVPEYYMIRPHSPRLHCGCKNKSIFTYHPLEYRVWMMMHTRCEDPKHVAFKHYGGRGIGVCAEWHKSRGEEGFKAFIEYMGPRKSTRFSIDRIDNNKGYEPGNVRWATSKQQRANQRTPEQLAEDRKKYNDKQRKAVDGNREGNNPQSDAV